jgi:gliding motility-associated-like protein
MKLKLLVIIFLAQFSLLSPAVLGQFCDKGGGAFTITPSPGCYGEKIQLKNDVANAENVKYVYNFSRQEPSFPDKKDETEDLSYVYNAPGNYVILQYGSLNGSGFTACKDVAIKETRAPRADLLVCPNGKVRLMIVKDNIALAYDQIEINWGDGSQKETWTLSKDLIVDHQYKTPGTTPPITINGKHSGGLCQSFIKTSVTTGSLGPPVLSAIKILSVEMQADGVAKIVYNGLEGIETLIMIDKGDGTYVSTGKIGSTGGTQSAFVENLDPAKVYKFKLSSKNICDDLIDSHVVSSMVVQQGTLALDEINSLTWPSYVTPADVLNYQIKRDGVVIATTTELSYLDKDVKCGTTYKYDIVAIVKDDVRSYSATIEIEPKTSAPEVIGKAMVTVKEENVIETTVELGGQGLTSSFDINIERSVSGTSGWEKVSGNGNQSLTYTDTGVNTGENSYCYRFSYTNACKLSSPDFSRPVCSILLKRNAKDISWTNASPFTDNILSFEVGEMDRAGAEKGSIPVGIATNYPIDLNDQDISAFVIKASSAGGNFTSYSNVVSFIREAIVLVPDAFTPNGDGINEQFQIKSYFADSFKLFVYDRWGSVIFHTADSSQGWDGNYKGTTSPAGYYFYKVEVIDTKGRTISKNGGFLLIR